MTSALDLLRGLRTTVRHYAGAYESSRKYRSAPGAHRRINDCIILDMDCTYRYSIGCLLGCLFKLRHFSPKRRFAPAHVPT